MYNDYKSPHHHQQLAKQLSGLEMLLLLDETGRITFAGPSFLSGLGYQAEEVVEHSLFDYVHPEDQAAIQTALKLVLSQTGVPIRRDVRFRWQAGGWLELEATLTDLPAATQMG
ncbi:MAG: PAS domain-containing protein, partial [Anaerolineae bacterium]|nr:PAS domain-containing protein [Anaerolineae bacterium]